MNLCPKCNKIGVDVVDRNEENGTITYQCCHCNWTETRSIDQPIVTMKDIVGVGTVDKNDKMILVIPENVGLGTKRLAPTGNSHHIFIDQRMMDAGGVRSGDLIHVLIWRVTSKSPEVVEDHE